VALIQSLVSIPVGSATFGPAAIADTISSSVTASLARWTTGTAVVTLDIEVSFDGGTTWFQLGGIGNVKANPTGMHGASVDPAITIPAYKMCSCGELYWPGNPANARLTVHSDWKGRDTTPLADLSSINFHTPDNQPATGLPLRQVRVRTTSTAAVSTTLTVNAV
jgi:hypothetical protein